MWDIQLNRSGEASLQYQLFRILKDGILSGKLAAGEALPSTRELAKELGVSRNTVCAAYDMLWTEGYILNRPGAPSRVAEGLSLRLPEKPDTPRKADKQVMNIRWDFATGKPDLTAFPWKQWNEGLKQAAESLTETQFAYTGPKGYAPLCEALAGWLKRARNLDVHARDIFITSGSTQALYLLTEILHQNGRGFGLENPSHPGVRTMIRDKGYPLCWMPADEHGADIAALQGQALSAVYVTPSHQYPLGGILPADRRAALIRLAEDRDFYIIEDDYDSEFRYTGTPISPIRAMSASRIVYVGTFSKTLFPALRIGFVVLPEALQQQWKHSRNYMDVQNPVLEQAALAWFLQTRRMDKHIRRMKRLYGQKRQTLLLSLHSTFGDTAIPQGDASGLHIALRFPDYMFGEAFAKQCEKTGIRILPVSKYAESASAYHDTLLLGYGHLTMEQIEQGVKALFDAVAAIK
ncbi:MAG TPA: PLP-dependent aminotransferase family protein [Candidatus Limiplasma sp.]|nr:PLP-dependent aminotransferase family protein [Candidatus Limiplasma sp.]